MKFEEELNKVLNKLFCEFFDYERSEKKDSISPEDKKYRQELRLVQAPGLLWSYYLGGHKKQLLGNVPHLVAVPPLSALASDTLSDGTTLKVGDKARWAYGKRAQEELIEWLTDELDRDVSKMKVFQVMRIARQYLEVSQASIEDKMKNPFGNMTIHKPESEPEPEEDVGEYGMGGDYWK